MSEQTATVQSGKVMKPDYIAGREVETTNAKDIVPLSIGELATRCAMDEVSLHVPSDCTLDDLRAIAKGIAGLENARNWYYGDFALAIANRFKVPVKDSTDSFKDNDEAASIVKLVGKAYQTCVNAMSVCRVFPASARVYRVSFEMYKEARAIESKGERVAFLKAAEHSEMSVKVARELKRLPAPARDGAVKAIVAIKSESTYGKRKEASEIVTKYTPKATTATQVAENAAPVIETRPHVSPDFVSEKTRALGVKWTRDFSVVATTALQTCLADLGQARLAPYDDDKLPKLIDMAKALREHLNVLIAKGQELLDATREDRMRAKSGKSEKTSTKDAQRLADSVNKQRVQASA